MSRIAGPTARAGGRRALLCLVLALLALGLCSRVGFAGAVTGAQVSSADGAIQSGFASAYAAERSGGNVSALDAKLNEAIQLVQAAESLNSTDPVAAAADLQNATSLAQSVSAESASVAHAGSAARQTTEAVSAGAASAILLAAGLTYAFGGQVYRRAWLRLHEDYVVSPADG